MAFVGRLHPSKGVHVVVAALVGNRVLPMTLDVYGIVQDAEGERYRDELRALAADDPRIRFCAPLPRDRVVDTLADYDLTVVPSQWLETGPLVVLESFAAGVPVLGSNLGGIGELVRHDRDGWLVRYDDPRAWSSALQRFATDRAHVERLRGGVERPRSTGDVARDMVVVYESVAAAAVRRGFHVAASIA
jgi:glycosyltransferase involved in cell wall biosynthesis